MKPSRIENNEYGLAHIHEQLMETLDAFDQICRENGICYSLHGGTLLGAERNHHLIPWDDDMDVSMRKSDYHKFLEVMQSKGDSFGYYIDDKTLWVPHFMMKETDDPIYIDIFIWDYISEKPLGRKLKITLLHAIQGMMKDGEFLDIDRFGLKDRILVLGTYWFGKLFTQKFKLRMYTAVGTRWLQGKHKCIHRYNDSFRGLTYVHDSEYMNRYAEIELEGKNYMVNERYKEFLITEYGLNFMTPPAEKDRIPAHNIMRQRIQKTEGKQ